MDKANISDNLTNSDQDLDTSSDYQLAAILQQEFDKEDLLMRTTRNTSSTLYKNQHYDQYDDGDDSERDEEVTRRSSSVRVNDSDSILPRGTNSKRNSKDRGTDKSNSNRVLNNETNMILFKLGKTGILNTVLNCFSSGKEASVFHGISPEGSELAVKIYMTSTLGNFKGRDIFLRFDPRLRNKVSSKKTKKFIHLWALKEFLNLNKIHSNGILCPEPIRVKKHVLVMSLVGFGQVEAPTLQSVVLSRRDLIRAYEHTIEMMENLYKKCQLVHTHLSAFNLLYHKGHVWVVDVAQAVLTSHPYALQFLLGDVRNIVAFFATKGIAAAEEIVFKRVTGLSLEGLKGDLAEQVLNLDTYRAKSRNIEEADYFDDFVADF